MHFFLSAPRSDGTPPLGGAKTPTQQQHQHQQPPDTRTHAHWDESGCSFIPRILKSISLTARGRCQKLKCSQRKTEGLYIKKTIKRKSILETRNYARQPGVLSSCCGTPADGKLRVKAGGPATFIDFQVHPLQVSTSTSLNLSYSRIARLEGFGHHSSVFRLCAVGGVFKRHGDGISVFCGWQWRMNEKGPFWGLIDSTTTGRSPTPPLK